MTPQGDPISSISGVTSRPWAEHKGSQGLATPAPSAGFKLRGSHMPGRSPPLSSVFSPFHFESGSHKVPRLASNLRSSYLSGQINPTEGGASSSVTGIIATLLLSQVRGPGQGLAEPGTLCSELRHLRRFLTPQLPGYTGDPRPLYPAGWFQRGSGSFLPYHLVKGREEVGPLLQRLLDL